MDARANLFTAKTKDEMPTQGEVFARSGLEFMQDMLAGKVTCPPMCAVLNYYPHAVEPGKMIFRGSPEFQHTNPLSAVHGGWYGTLLDSAMGCAVMTVVPKGATYTTLEYKINITRALPLGTEVDAIATVQHGGRSTGVAIGEIRGVADGKLYATGSTTCIILHP